MTGPTGTTGAAGPTGPTGTTGADGPTGADGAGAIAESLLDAKGDLIVASAADTAARLAVGGTNGHVLTVDSGETTGMKWAAAAAGSEVDPVATLFGTPDTAYEFASTSLAGLTAIGTPDTEDADTTIPDCLYYADNTSSTAWMGRYVASPSAPFTAITKVLSDNANANYAGAGLLVGVTDPTTGAFVVNTAAFSTNRRVDAGKFTNRTTFSASIGNSLPYYAQPVWLAVIVNSTTSIDYLWSMNGWIWRKYVSANNPSLTVGSIGLAMKSENAGGFSCAFDYLRIWNSAKTFVGV